MRRLSLLSIVMGVFLILISTPVIAGQWPSKPIKLTIAYGAGGTTDATARLLASLLEEELGQTVICQNKPGGGGSVAATIAATQRPDGYNIFTLVTAPAVITPHMQDVPFDPLTDFTPIARYALWNLGIVVPTDSPFKTLKDLIAYAKQHPGEITYGVSGTGTPQHLVMERIAMQEQIEWRAIPFKNGSEAVTAALGKHVQLMAGATEWISQVRGGDLRLLTILTDKKMKEFPSVPTLEELGYSIAAPSILGIAGPKGIPEEIVEKLDIAISKVIQDPKFISLMEKIVMQVAYLGHEDFKNHIKESYATQGEILKKAGLAKK